MTRSPLRVPPFKLQPDDRPQGELVIRDVIGIHRIRMLYLQLLYRCNFSCLHCFHGNRLRRTDAFTVEEAGNLLALVRGRYGTESVTLLGGEPFLYKGLPQVVRHAKRALGMKVEIRTNGYRIERTLTEIAPDLDLLRVSLDGVGATHDIIRRQDSYAEALETLDIAHHLGIPTGVTLTVTALNLTDVVPLAETLERLNVRQLKLHRMRLVGNARRHRSVLAPDVAAYGALRRELQAARLSLDLLLDEDLSVDPISDIGTAPGTTAEIDRVEVDPRGALSLSCQAVGTDTNAFWYDKNANRIVHRPTTTDELATLLRNVAYAHV